MNVSALHASFELKQRINRFQPILDDGAQTIPGGVYGRSQSRGAHRLPGRSAEMDSGTETITVEDADFCHVLGSKQVSHLHRHKLQA